MVTHRFGRFELDEEARQLRRDAEPVPLQPLVFDLLALLVAERRRVVSKDELLDRLWPEVTVTEASLQRAVSVARSVLDDRRHELIRTFSRYGYRFCAALESAEDARAAESPPAEALPAEPEIHHARTRDGVDIAYWTLGDGPTLVYLPNLIWSHGQLEWRVPEIRHWYLGLARARRLVRIDPRGTGLSQREVESYSLPAIQLDLEAVADRLGLDTFSIFGDLNAGAVAVRFAAEHPERVSRLVLWHTFARWSEIEGPRMSMLESLQPLMDREWETYTETRAHMGFGWSDGESAHRYAGLMRECALPELARRSYAAGHDEDLTPLLGRISAPTLVLHRRAYYFWDVQVSRDLAARIPGSRLAVLEGAASSPFLGDADEVVRTVDEFLRP